MGGCWAAAGAAGRGPAARAGAWPGRRQRTVCPPTHGRLRFPGPALVEGEAAAGSEAAPSAPLPGRWLLPGYPRHRAAAARAGHRREQGRRVRVQRPAQQRAGRARFHDSPGVHDGHPGRQLAHHGQVVTDVHGGHLVMAAQAAQGVQDVPLRGDVQAGGGLVQHDQRGAAGEGHGQPDALLLAAGQLMRVPPQQVRRRLETGLAQHLGDPGLRLTRGHGVHQQRLA